MTFENKNKEEILAEAGKRGVVSKADNTGGAIEVHDYEKLAITVRCTEDIQASLKSLENQLAINAMSSDKVGKRVFWLNVVLTLATIVGALATAISAFKT